MEIKDSLSIEALLNSKLLKPTEVAELLNISKSFAYRLLQSGNIPTIHLGKSVRVRMADLENFIKSNVKNVGNGI